MTSSRRILLLSAAGVVLYLALSLYHGHLLKKYPGAQATGETGSPGRGREKNWVQVSTTDHHAGDSVLLRGQVDPTAIDNVPPPAATGEPELSADPRTEAAALRMELQKAMALLKNREEDLQQATLQLATAEATTNQLRGVLGKERDEKQEALDVARRLREELGPARQERGRQLAEVGRLQTELKEARTRAAIAEGELERARLKADAMYRYGQEQSRRYTPNKEEMEILKVRLQDTGSKLHQAEEEIAVLKAREEKLRGMIHILRSERQGSKHPEGEVRTGDAGTAGPTAEPAPADSAGPAETRAGRQTD